MKKINQNQPENDKSQNKEEYLKALQVLKAEYDNYRKRIESERSVKGKQVLEDFFKKLLAVLDAFEEGVKNNSDTISPIYKLFLSSLQNEGLEIIRPKIGEEFNPNYHEAVGGCLSSENDVESEFIKIVNVLRSGYILNNKLLRSASVEVDFD